MKIIMSIEITAPCSYSRQDKAGQELVNGDAQANLNSEHLSILPKSGEPLYLSLVDIIEILPRDYRIEMTLSSNEKIALFNLGYKFDDLVSNLYQYRNEIILKYLLMNESIKRSKVFGELAARNASGAGEQFEKCELRLYETSIVLLPTTGDPYWIHFSNISKMEVKDYSILIIKETGEQFVVSKLGRDFEGISRDLSDAINQLNVKTQSLLKELLPSADPSVIFALSRLMKDGKVAKSVDIKSISPMVWTQFENRLEQTPIWAQYQYLKSISIQEKIGIGIKRGLMGDITGNYLFLLIPIDNKESQYGNAVALEAVKLQSGNTTESEGTGDATESDFGATGGNATYFFRITRRNEYPEVAKNRENLDKKIDSALQMISQAMLDINFRREPIFLTDEKLESEPKYAKYRYAARRIPSFTELRNIFVGRIIHSSLDQWKSDVQALLNFNMTAKDDSRWQK